ncbi:MULTISPECIES: glycoside hydrolase family 13 protein [Oscillospiraceae]|uniref:Alpha-glucosidase n=1 Tax=Bittarella massiliensis (ex Durand et al. 2017) TaxID=1720313 RepID=A0AAW5KCN2_9FIRM|nr:MULTISPECIES: alpha-glucosidase [Oscillospiraceae]MCQ4948734.1 alpha-glucosidase [Bittarella massiliensis (ex Durand et al. 2017)]
METNKRLMQDPDWWRSATVYQIYPRSFFDSDGDGEGDLAGISQKLDYIKSLGVDVVWSCPYFVSPKADNGYDVADYRAIDPAFGTMEQWQEMVDGIHARGMRFVMDFVGNHTSDEHPWFEAARQSKDSPYHDYYIFREGKNGAEPSNWASVFGGSIWEYNQPTGEYYLHTFAVKQPDLNWENPKVVDEVVDILKFWVDRGVDGFRLDAINYLYKEPDFPDVEPMPGSKYGFANQHYANKPRVNEHFRDLNERVFGKYGMMTVAEVAYVDMETARQYCGPDRRELNMLYLFDLLNIDQEGFDKFSPKPLDLPLFKKTALEWQQGLHGQGWQALFMDNHDQPRAVSRFGDDGVYWKESAKMLANCFYMMQGTPYIFQGDEIGMTNVHYDSVEKFRDVEVFNTYEERKAAGESDEALLKVFCDRARDNGRTPMQWDDSENAGFTAGTPWIEVNDNYRKINVASQEGDPDSILNFYRELIAKRKQWDVIAYGDMELYHPDCDKTFGYIRRFENQALFCLSNFTGEEIEFHLPEEFLSDRTSVLLQNYPGLVIAPVITLRPYESFTLVKED